MAEQEKKAPKSLSEEEWKKAFESWKVRRASDTDFDELETPLRADLVDALHGKHKTPEEN